MSESKVNDSEEKATTAEQEVAESPSPAPAAPVDHEILQPMEKKGKGGFLPTAAFLFSATALVFTWYVWQEGQSGSSQLSQNIEARQQEIIDQRKKGRDLETQLTLLEKAFAEQGEQYQKMQLQLESHQGVISQMRTSSAEDWKLAEAEHLLSLANEQLLVQRDSAVAIKLVERVDQILAGMRDRSVKPLRQVIANDLQQIKSSPPVDVDGLYTRLDAAIDQLNNLPLLMKTSVTTQEKDTSDADLTWWESFEELLGQYIQIRRLNQPVKPLLAPEQELFLRHNLRLNLEQAQLALLKGEQTVYRESLRQAADWVDQHFDNREQPVKGMVEVLQNLSNEPVTQSTLDLNASQVALRQFVLLREKAALGLLDTPPVKAPVTQPSLQAPSPQNSQPPATKPTTQSAPGPNSGKAAPARQPKAQPVPKKAPEAAKAAGGQS